MFGYISVNKPELKVRDFDVYHAHYCGICHALRERSGPTARLTLTYDMSFLALLLNALYEGEESTEYRRCPLRPWNRCAATKNAYTSYAADMNVLLSYYNLLDDWLDDRNIPHRLLAASLSSQVRRIREEWPRQSAAVENYVQKLSQVESSDSRDPDLAAGLTGDMLGEIFVFREDCWADRLRHMGCCLGRYIYLMDAYEDLPKDLVHGAYNPWRSMPENTLEEDSRIILTQHISECCRAFEQLPILQQGDLLRNILYSGIWTKYEQVRTTRQTSPRSTEDAAATQGAHDD